MRLPKLEGEWDVFVFPFQRCEEQHFFVYSVFVKSVELLFFFTPVLIQYVLLKVMAILFWLLILLYQGTIMKAAH